MRGERGGEAIERAENAGDDTKSGSDLQKDVDVR
jgi:hypothetical protein